MLYQNVQIVGVIIKQLHLGAQQGKKLRQRYGKIRQKKPPIEKRGKLPLKVMKTEKFQSKTTRIENSPLKAKMMKKSLLNQLK